MRQTKPSRLRVWGLLSVIGVLVLIVLCCYPWELSVRDCFRQDPAPFETVVRYFSEQPPPRAVLIMDRKDAHEDFRDVEVALPNEVQEAVRDIFRRSSCEYIFCSGHLDYCEFCSSDKRTQRNLAYLSTAENESDVLFSYTAVLEKEFLSEHWMYYETYTYFREKELGLDKM